MTPLSIRMYTLGGLHPDPHPQEDTVLLSLQTRYLLPQLTPVAMICIYVQSTTPRTLLV